MGISKIGDHDEWSGPLARKDRNNWEKDSKEFRESLVGQVFLGAAKSRQVEEFCEGEFKPDYKHWLFGDVPIKPISTGETMLNVIYGVDKKYIQSGRTTRMMEDAFRRVEENGHVILVFGTKEMARCMQARYTDLRAKFTYFNSLQAQYDLTDPDILVDHSVADELFKMASIIWGRWSKPEV